MLALVRAVSGVALLAVPVLLTGCNDGPKVVRVAGTVTRNGKPVPYLTVNFIPEVGRPSWGLTDEQGRFTLEYDNTTKGALVGTHTVWVLWRPASPQEEIQGPKGGRRPPELEAIRAKYGSQEKSPLKIEIARAVDDLEVKLD